MQVPGGALDAQAHEVIVLCTALCLHNDKPVSRGGTLCRPVDKDLAEEIRQFRSPTDDSTRMFYEIVIAPGYTPEGLAHLQGKSKTLRILEAQPRQPTGRTLRQISGETKLRSTADHDRVENWHARSQWAEPLH